MENETVKSFDEITQEILAMVEAKKYVKARDLLLKNNEVDIAEFIEDLEPEALKDFFPEFEAYEDECRFLGCVHIGERECGVKTAVQEHKIGQSRYDNYRLMYQELKEKKKYGRSSR